MSFKSVLVFLGLSALFPVVTAQQSSVSPYSAYGVGDLLFDQNIEQASMGGLSMIPLNPYHASGNFLNPAANRDMRFTSFDAGVNAHIGRFNDGTNKATQTAIYLSQVSLIFPVGDKARAGFGFKPFSSIGYQLGSRTDQEDVSYLNRFTGDGGLNSFHLVGSYNVSKEFSLGIRMDYLFGDMNRVETVFTDGLALNTDYKRDVEARGVQMGITGMYTKIFKDKKRLDIGAAYTLNSNLSANIENMTITYSLFGLEPTNIDTVSYSKVRGSLKVPQSIAFGASYRKELHWMVGAQVDYGNWQDFNINPSTNLKLNSRFRFSTGGFWIPDFNSYKSYFNRVIYRFGAFYESTPVVVNNQGIDKFGVTFGFGMPIGKDRDASMLNLGFELGSIGNTRDIPVKENYINIRAGFTINDMWFRKRVID